jgi:NAD(P)-dependent dehydrogenase (short-subunit alcohol dehydrogenase family)
MEVSDRTVAFITGGAGGIGLGMASAFTARGVKAVLADVDGDRAQAAAAQLKGLDREVLAVELDVADRRAWDRAADRAESMFGSVSLLCNNAGVSGALDTYIEDLTPELWQWSRSINLDGVYNGMNAFVPRMKERRGEHGHIVNTGSLASVAPFDKVADYCATKYGVAGMTLVARRELAPFRIGVSLLCPGYVRSGLLDSSALRKPPGGAGRQYLDEVAKVQAMGMDPLRVGEIVLAAIRDDRTYIFTHPEFRGPIDEAQRVLMQDLAWAERGFPT